MKTISLLLASLLLLSGCATTGGNVASQDKQPIAKIAVTYATMKVIENNPEYAARIIAIAEGVKLVTAGDTVNTVALLNAYIKAQVDWTKLSPADAMMIQMLLGEVGTQLEQRLGAGTFTGANVLVVSQVAGWIEDAAKMMPAPNK